MPIYEYECQSCGHRVEVIQKHTDPPLTECQRCRGALTKLIAPPALQFKGAGWYITDYSDKGKAPKTAGEADKGATKSASPAESAPSNTPGAEKKSDSSSASSPPKSEGGSKS